MSTKCRQTITCPNCEGKGWTPGECPICDARGFLIIDSEATAELPRQSRKRDPGRAVPPHGSGP